MNTGHSYDTHGHGHEGHGHSHGLVARSILSSREGLKAVGWSLLVLLVTAAAQLAVFVVTDSIALLADLIHNFGDALTAIPLGIALEHLLPLAIAGIIGFAGNEVAALIRTRAGQRLNSPALIADGAHARTDGLVSLSVVASAIVVGLGFHVGDPIIGLIITLVILRITWQSFRTVQQDPNETIDDHQHQH